MIYCANYVDLKTKQISVAVLNFQFETFDTLGLSHFANPDSIKNVKIILESFDQLEKHINKTNIFALVFIKYN